MTRTMRDSTSAPDALAGPADLYGGYSDGIYANLPALRAGAPAGAVIVEFCAIGTDTGIVGDTEPGCIWPPANAVPWVVKRRAAGVDPSIYVGRANWPAVIAAFNTAGVPQPHYAVAHYNNNPHFCDGFCFPSSVDGLTAVSTQYGGDLAGHYDLSIVADYWPGIDTSEDDLSEQAEQQIAELHAWLDPTGDSVGGTVRDTGQRVSDVRAWLDPTGVGNLGQTIIDARRDVASLVTLIGDPASGALVRLAQIQAALAALPAGTTADSPAAAQALADIAMLKDTFTVLGSKLGAAA